MTTPINTVEDKIASYVVQPVSSGSGTTTEPASWQDWQGLAPRATPRPILKVTEIAIALLAKLPAGEVGKTVDQLSTELSNLLHDAARILGTVATQLQNRLDQGEQVIREAVPQIKGFGGYGEKIVEQEENFVQGMLALVNSFTDDPLIGLYQMAQELEAVSIALKARVTLLN